jgi:hypothetical protein
VSCEGVPDKKGVVTKLGDMTGSFMIVDEDSEGMEVGFITMALIIDVQVTCVLRHCSVSAEVG